MSIRGFASSGLVVGVLAGLGCSGSSTSADKACGDFASSYCSRLDACSHYQLRELFDTVDACASRTKPVCLSTTRATGTGLSASNYESCAQGWSSLSCDDLLQGKRPAACNVTGSQAVGAGCGADSQCTTGYCKVDFFQNCGVCAERVAAGAMCSASGDCPDGTVCISPGMCVATVAAGGDCTAAPCAGLLQCQNGTCGALLGMGSACSPGNPDPCDSNQGLSCDDTMHKCVPQVFANVGSTCATSDDSGLATTNAACPGSSTCGTSNTCEPALADGADCEAGGGGAMCLYPAQCVNKKCTVPDPAACH